MGTSGAEPRGTRSGGPRGPSTGERIRSAAATWLAVACILGLVSVAYAQGWSFAAFVPLVVRQSPTPELRLTPLPGPCVAPGDSVHFRDWLRDMPLEARAVECYRLSQLRDEEGELLRPTGVYITIVADVRNYGVQPGEVGLTRAFRLQTAGGVRYDLAPETVQRAASLAFGRPTVLTPIPAGVTIRHVFVFDLPTNTGTITLVSEYPW